MFTRQSAFRCLVVIGCLVPLAVNCISAFGLPFYRPSLSCGNSDWDAGELKGKTIEILHTFELRNDGTRSLVVDAVRPQCGCTTTQPSTFPLVIGPGTAASLATRTRLKGVNGSFRKLIYIDSSDPKKAQFMLSVRGKVLGGI